MTIAVDWDVKQQKKGAHFQYVGNRYARFE